MNLGAVSFLVVDDNRFMRNLVVKVLRALGSGPTHEAENGREAITAIRAGLAPDIAIVDWEMAPVDGIELVRWIRSAPDSPDRFLPVIMLSAHSEMRRVSAARDAGVTEFMVKPASAKVILGRIRAVIERPRRFVKTKDYFGPDRRRQIIDPRGEERRKSGARPQRADAMSQEAINAFFNGEAEPRKGV